MAIGAQQLWFWVRAPRTRMAWLYDHIGGMGATCIATMTAFVVVNARHLGLPAGSLVAWIAPGVLGGVGITLWQRHFRARYERRGAAGAPPGDQAPAQP